MNESTARTPRPPGGPAPPPQRRANRAPTCKRPMGLPAAAVLIFLMGLTAAAIQPSATPGAGPAARGNPPRPVSLLLVTIDTWRWDYIGVSGSGKVKTPALDRLAREGVYEREAVTPCPLTTPAHASLFTGLVPLHHGVWDCTSYKLEAGHATLSQLFHERGFRTAAFIAGETLKQRYGLDRGFDCYDDSGMEKRARGDWMSSSRDGAAVTQAVLTYLRGSAGADRLFLWAHYFDLHRPYRPRPGLDALFARDPYAAQVAYVDGQIAHLLAAIEADPGRSWRVIVVGDHGEGLGEKGEDTHGMGLYRATLHVPLILWPKPDKPLIHPRPWGLVDLAPTIEAWFGLGEAAGKTDGEDLFKAGKKDRWLTAASLEPTLLFGVRPFTGIRQGRFLYLKDGSEELYDLVLDPAQEHDLARERGSADTLASLRAIGRRTWPKDWPKLDIAPTLKAESEQMKTLQSLGYISGGVSSEPKLPDADMRKVLLDRSAWDRAREEAYLTKKGDALLELYPKLVADYPASVALHRAYGTLLAQAGRRPEAIRQLEAAVRLDGRDGASLTNLGGLYLQEGRTEPAELCLTRALEIDATNAVAHQNLGVLYSQYRKDPARAVQHFQSFLELDPNSPDAPAARDFIARHGTLGAERRRAP